MFQQNTAQHRETTILFECLLFICTFLITGFSISSFNKPSLANRILKRSPTLTFYVLAESVESWTRPKVLTAVHANTACLDL